MKRALDDVIWQSRCDTGDVQMYMTAVFGDRMRKRQAMLASAQTVRPSESAILEPHALHDDSGSRMAPVLPRKITERPVNKRSWIGGVVLAAGVMLGIGVGVRLIGGKFGQGESAAATTDATVSGRPPASIDKAPKQNVMIARPKVDVQVAKLDDSDDSVPTLRSRLRPEHLEPMRVVLDPEPEPEKTDRTKTPMPTPVPEPEAAPVGPSPKELYDKASALVIAGNVREAIRIYKELIDNGYAPAHRGLGYAYQQMSMDGLALDSYRRYLALVPGAADAATVRRRIEQLGGQP